MNSGFAFCTGMLLVFYAIFLLYNKMKTLRYLKLMYSAVEYHIVSNMYPGAYCLCGPIYPIILRKIVVWLV